MKKIASICSYSYVVASAIAAPWMAMCDLRLLPTCIWGFGLMFATVGMFLTEEKEKTPDDREINQGHRKIYNFNLSKGWGEVNGRAENL